MEEIWKPVNIEEGYESNYHVSNTGKIKRLNSGRILKGRNNGRGKGYYKVALYKDGKCKNFYVHRIVAFAFLPIIPSKNEVNHKDGDPNNNSLENLEWCSRQDNMKHAAETGLLQDNFKLKENKDKIQKLMLEGYDYKELSKIFGCHPGHINRFALKEGLELPYKRVVKFTSEDLIYAHELLCEGLNFREIGEILNFAEETIHRNLMKHYGSEYINQTRSKEKNKRRSSIDSPIGVTERVNKDGSTSYSARLSIGSDRINLGTYNSLEKAVAARNNAELKYWKKFN